MKKALKIIGCVLVALLCVTLLVYAGSIAMTGFPTHHQEPVMMDSHDVFEAEKPLEAEPEEEEPAEAEPEEEEAPPEEEPAEEEVPEEEPVATPLSDYEEQAKAYMEKMTLEEKIWQMIMTTPDKLAGEANATRAGEASQTFLSEKPVGGVCFFGANLVDQAQAKVLLMSTQTYSKTPLFLAVDEEGGRVSRCGANEKIEVTHFDAAATYGEKGSENEVYNVGKTLAKELGVLGFNLDFAPVADVITNENNTEIGDRAYSDDPAVAGAMVSSMVKGMQRNGMAACLKHFPGHGSTEADSHQGVSVSTRTIDELRQTEWVPFKQGIDAGAAFVMVGHQTNKNISELPASLSPVTYTYLREELGFRGVAITDALNMGAIKDYYTSAQAAVLAVQAGADILLMPNDLGTAVKGITEAIEKGTITEARIDESVLRILETKYLFGIMQ